MYFSDFQRRIILPFVSENIKIHSNKIKYYFNTKSSNAVFENNFMRIMSGDTGPDISYLSPKMCEQMDEWPPSQFYCCILDTYLFKDLIFLLYLLD